jgi:nuclear pore complex protein Nup205
MLVLIQEVLRNSENVRIRMNENLKWKPIETFFGLLSFKGVPPVLKGQLMRTIAAFAKSPELVGKVRSIISLFPFLCK